MRAQVDFSLAPPRSPDTVSITCWMMPRFRSPGTIARPTTATCLHTLTLRQLRRVKPNVNFREKVQTGRQMSDRFFTLSTIDEASIIKCDMLSLLHAHTRLTALCPGLPGWAGNRKVKPIWILLNEETVSGSGISWATCKSAPRFRQIATPAHHQWVFYWSDALPDAQPTASKQWRHTVAIISRKTCPVCCSCVGMVNDSKRTRQNKYARCFNWYNGT